MTDFQLVMPLFLLLVLGVHKVSDTFLKQQIADGGFAGGFAIEFDGWSKRLC